MMTRRINGIAALVLAVFFAIHEAMGALFVDGFVTDGLAWLVWAGVAVVAAHICLSAATTRAMLADTERPPSSKKKRHMAKKWVTGGLVCVAVLVHVLVSEQMPDRIWVAVCLVLATLLAVHVCVSAKSLAADLDCGAWLKNAARIFIVAATVAISVLLLLG